MHVIIHHRYPAKSFIISSIVFFFNGTILNFNPWIRHPVIMCPFHADLKTRPSFLLELFQKVSLCEKILCKETRYICMHMYFIIHYPANSFIISSIMFFSAILNFNLWIRHLLLQRVHFHADLQTRLSFLLELLPRVS